MSGPWAGRIVVGYDGSEPARDAVAWAVAEARLRHLPVTIVHTVLPPVSASAFGPGLPAPLELLDEILGQARRELAELAGSLAGAGDLDIATEVEVGSAAGVLIEASQQAAMVVIGSRGRGGFAGLLLGSTGDQVASHARCPAVVVRGPQPAGADTIVVGVDGSPISDEAVRFAFATASERGWRVVAVHAWDVPSYDLITIPGAPVPVALHDIGDDEVRLSAEVLAGVREDFPEVDVAERVVRGSAATAIADAVDGSVALVAVGSGGHGQLAGIVLGSTSRAVLHRVGVPVVIVPGRKS